jgi:hypothetical protein
MVRILVLHVAEAKVVARARRRRAAVITGLFALIAGVAWLLAAAPPFVAFGLAITSAVAWCIWLERHLEAAKADWSRPHGTESDAPPYSIEPLGCQQSFASSFTLVAAASGRKTKRTGEVRVQK